MKHLRRGHFEQVLQKPTPGGGVVVHKITVGFAHQIHRFLARGHHTLRHQRLHAGNHGGLNRQRHPLHSRNRVGCGTGLGHATKVKAVANAQALNLRDIVWRQAAQMVRAKHQTAPHTLPAGGDVAPEIAEVGGALQGASDSSLHRVLKLKIKHDCADALGNVCHLHAKPGSCPAKIRSFPRSVAARRLTGAAGQAWGRSMPE